MGSGRRDARRDSRCAACLPATSTIKGRINQPPSRYLELASDTAKGRVWQNLDLARYAKATGHALLPIVVEQTLAAGPG